MKIMNSFNEYLMDNFKDQVVKQEVYAGKDEAGTKLKLLDWNIGSRYSKRSSVKKTNPNERFDVYNSF